MNDELIKAIVVAVIGTPLLLYILSNDVSTRIRNSDYWFLGFALYLLLVPSVISSWFYIADKL